MPQKKAGEATGKAASGSVFSAISKLRSGDDVTLTKDELLGLLFIVKLGGALVTGLAAGALPLQGYAGFAAFAASCAALPFITYRSILQVDEELYGGHQTLLMEDLNIALALFLLTWILTYSSIWF